MLTAVRRNANPDVFNSAEVSTELCVRCTFGIYFVIPIVFRCVLFVFSLNGVWVGVPDCSLVDVPTHALICHTEVMVILRE